jgi:hypothetical protein
MIDRSSSSGGALASDRHTILEKRLPQPHITVPTITLEGDANGAPYRNSSAYATKFSGKYSHRTINGGKGHNLPFAEAVIEVDGYEETFNLPL